MLIPLRWDLPGAFLEMLYPLESVRNYSIVPTVSQAFFGTFLHNPHSFCSESFALPQAADVVVDALEEPAECRRCLVDEHRRERRAEDAALTSAVAKRNALPGLSDAVAVRTGRRESDSSRQRAA